MQKRVVNSSARKYRCDPDLTLNKKCPDQLHICNNLPVLTQDDFLEDF